MVIRISLFKKNFASILLISYDKIDFNYVCMRSLAPLFDDPDVVRTRVVDILGDCKGTTTFLNEGFDRDFLFN